jgi:hypothetical protein
MNLVLILIWSMAILAGYYFFHKPISPEQALALAQAGLDLGLAALILAGAGGLGRRCVRSVNLAGLENFAVSAAVGLGVFSLVWFALGAVHAIYWWAAWLLLILVLLVFRKDILAWLRDGAEIAHLWKDSPRFEKTLAAVGAVMVGVQLIVALAPPLKWDALTYHLASPQQYIADHFLGFNLASPYAGQPQLAEMLFTWAMQLHRAETASVLAWGVGVICLLGILGLTTSLARSLQEAFPFLSLKGKPEAAGWMAVVAVLVGFTFRSMLGWSYTDLFSAMFGVAALTLLFAWIRSGGKSAWLWLAAVCGLAVSVKWTSGIVVVGVFLAPLLFRKNQRLPAGMWLAGAAIALAVFAPWMVRDLVAAGNPVYPFVFQNTAFSAWRLAAANLPSDGLNWVSGAALPVTLTLTGVDSASGFSTDIGPLLVMLAVPALWIYRKQRAIWALALVLSLTWLVIATLGLRFGHLTQPRLYYAALPALAVLAGLSWAWLQTLTYQGIRLRRILGAMVALVCGLALIQDVANLSASGAPAVIAGMESAQAYRSANLGWYATLDDTLSALPSGSQVLALWEPRKLYLPDNAIPDYWIDLWRATAHKNADPAAILADWKAQGITHLLVYVPGEQFMRENDRSTRPEDWTAFDRLVQQLPAPQAVGDTYRLYSLP